MPGFRLIQLNNAPVQFNGFQQLRRHLNDTCTKTQILHQFAHNALIFPNRQLALQTQGLQGHSRGYRRVAVTVPADPRAKPQIGGNMPILARIIFA
ncbi:hypothetical protein D3C73_718250 [compost metagenome]